MPTPKHSKVNLIEDNMKNFKSFLQENLDHQAGSETTQVSNTTASYIKAAMKLKEVLGEKEDLKVLDYGAGLGLGTEAMRSVFGAKNVDSFEPSSARSKVKPSYSDANQITKKYDAIVCLNVLNVLEPGLRNSVVEKIISSLKPEGYALIGVRGWSGDVNQAKNSEPSKEEEKAIWINKNGTKVYQKGFDGSELLNYITGIDSSLKITRLKGITNNAVLIQKRSSVE